MSLLYPQSNWKASLQEHRQFFPKVIGFIRREQPCPPGGASDLHRDPRLGNMDKALDLMVQGISEGFQRSKDFFPLFSVPE